MTALDTRVPATIDALVAILLDQVNDVEVYDGAPSSDPDELGRDVVVVGTNYLDQLAVTGSTEGPAGLAPHPTELFTVGFVLSCIRGPGETKAARDRVAEVLAILSSALKADMRLGGICDRAQMATAWSWSTQRVIFADVEGVEVTYRGGVAVKALL